MFISYSLIFYDLFLIGNEMATLTLHIVLIMMLLSIFTNGVILLLWRFCFNNTN